MCYTFHKIDFSLIVVKHSFRPQVLSTGCRTVSNNGSGSGLAPAQNILAVQVWFRFTQVKYYWFKFGSGSLT